MGLVIGSVTDQQSVNLLAAAIGAVCSFMFAVFVGLVKYSVRRELDRLDKIQKRQHDRDKEQQHFNEWVKTILIINRLVPQPLPPDDRQ